MSKELKPKTRVIREAILAHPDLGPKGLAKLINGDEQREADQIRVTPGDVAGQQVAMRKSGASIPLASPPPTRPTPRPVEEAPPPVPARRKPRPRPAAPTEEPAPVRAKRPKNEPPAAPASPTQANPSPAPTPSRHSAPPRRRGLVDLLDRVAEVAEECGGLGELKRVVDRLLQLRG